MRRSMWLAPAVAALAAAWIIQAGGQEKPAPPKQEFGYVGSKACMMCHKNPERGDQYNKWLKDPHAKAYQTLAGEQAQKIATEKGLKTPANEAPECVRCHVTAWNAKPELLGKDYAKSEGVGCESCHGPAAQYRMVHQKDAAKAMTLGMIHPDEELCRGCHNEQSPTYKPFDYAKFSAVIAHPDPKKAAKK